VLLRFVIAPTTRRSTRRSSRRWPVWLVVNKILGLYDRSLNLLHKSTLNEWPTILQSILAQRSH